MKCKTDYADPVKYRNYKRRYQERYRKATGANRYTRRKYTEDEDKMIMEMKMPDRELSILLKRSVGAIQKRRLTIRKELHINA